MAPNYVGIWSGVLSLKDKKRENKTFSSAQSEKERLSFGLQAQSYRWDSHKKRHIYIIGTIESAESQIISHANTFQN